MFYFDNFFGKKVLKSTLLSDCEHFFTTRDFILHPGSISELQEKSDKNVDFLIEKLNILPENLYRCLQKHTANIEIASKNSANFFDNTDGIILIKKDTATFLNFADCIPIILYDSINKIGGVIHAGWRGTALKIQQQAVKEMFLLGSKSENIKVAIGPGIGKCCFDINEDVFEKIFHSIDTDEAKKQGAYVFSEKNNKYFVDLKLVNKILFNELSVCQIDISDYCTSCSCDIFFSYRKENANTARHSAILKI